MQTKSSLHLLTLSLAAIGLAFLPRVASAEPAGAASTITYPSTHTLTGNFKSTDGNKGTFVETVTLNSATSKSDTTVFTRDSDGATRTETRSTLINADGTSTVNYSDLAYKATAPFVSEKTVTKETHGQFYGQGTFTRASGTTGTLTTLENKEGPVNVVSAVYHNSDNTIENDLRLEDDGFGFVTVKDIDLDPAGKVTTVVHTRYITSSR